MKSLFELIFPSPYKTNQGYIIKEGDVVTPSHGLAKDVRIKVHSFEEGSQVRIQWIGPSYQLDCPIMDVRGLNGYRNEEDF